MSLTFQEAFGIKALIHLDWLCYDTVQFAMRYKKDIKQTRFHFNKVEWRLAVTGGSDGRENGQGH